MCNLFILLTRTFGIRYFPRYFCRRIVTYNFCSRKLSRHPSNQNSFLFNSKRCQLLSSDQLIIFARNIMQKIMKKRKDAEPFSLILSDLIQQTHCSCITASSFLKSRLNRFVAVAIYGLNWVVLSIRLTSMLYYREPPRGISFTAADKKSFWVERDE